MLANAKSDIGRVRQTNEDSYGCVNPSLYIVADGMGGHVAGEVASRLGVETVKAFIAERAAEEDAEGLLRQSVQAANMAIYRESHASSAYNGMGTTLSMVYLRGARCFWAHVGDSRIYLYRDDAMRQITEDHSLVWNLVASGTITAEEALSHPQRNMLTRAVGVEEIVTVDTGSFLLEEQDRLLLCSDGLTNMLGHAAIAAILGSAESDKAEALVNAAVEAGGVDNVTAVVLEY